MDIDRLLQKAEGGDVDSQYALGLYYGYHLFGNKFCYECMHHDYFCGCCFKFSGYISLGDDEDYFDHFDLLEAKYWLVKSAKQKHLPAIAMLDIHYKNFVSININLGCSKERLCA